MILKRRAVVAAIALISVVAAGCGSQDAAVAPAGDSTPVVLTDGSIATPTALPIADLPDVVPDGLEVIWETYSLLVREYVDREKVDPAVLSEAAVRGMIDALGDRYSSYIDPETYALEQQNFRGNFEGIGATVDLSPDGTRVIIIAPLEGSPAKLAGIKAGDKILAVDGKDATGWSVVDAVNQIRGRRGTPVVLTVEHVGSLDAVDVTIIRDTIEQPSVRVRQLADEPYGVLRIESFTAETARETREGVEELIEGGAGGIIIDLRGNPGGLLTATVDTASEFLTRGLVTYEIDGRGSRDDWEVRKGGKFPNIPLVVLVNGFSASGSEVLSGALQDHGRAVVIGTQTFGKGSVNLLRGLSNDGGVYLTIARWYTPNGRSLEEEGVTPDVVVEFPSAARQRDLDFEDPQLAAAIKQLDFQVATTAALP